MSIAGTMIRKGMIAAMAMGMPVMAAEKPASGTTLLADKASTNKTSRLFISGHSLTDRPFPDYLQEIAATRGTSIQWTMHHLPGSSILQRLHDKNAILVEGPQSEEHPPELQQNRSVTLATGGDDYDIMVITEQHRVLDSLIWQNSVVSLREYHDRFMAANAAGRTYFYAPWMGLSDRSNPLDWVAYEKEALPVWQCLVKEVNRELASEKRADRIQFIPASLALASLVEHLTADGASPGFEGLDTAAKVDALFSDGVHLRPLGVYYVAAISYSTIYPDNLPAPPPSLKASQAETVRKFAIDFMKTYRTAPVPSEQECSSGISVAFASYYSAYTERTIHRLEMGAFAARVKRIRDTVRFAWRFKNGLR